MTSFSAPCGLFLSSSTSKKTFWWKLTSNSFHQKKEKFWWKLKEYKPYPYPVGTFGPLPPHRLGFRHVCPPDFRKKSKRNMMIQGTKKLPVIINYFPLSFFQLLIVLSICDSLLIVFFILVSTSITVMSQPPLWFIWIFPYLLWPLGNISITSTVLMVLVWDRNSFIESQA